MGTSPPASLNGTPASRPRLGLVAQAPTVEDASTRWEGSYEFLPESCGAATGVGDPCVSEARAPTRSQANPDIVSVEPFVVWAADLCSPGQEREFESRGRRLLEACQSKQIEAEFWSGAQSIESAWGNKRLANDEDSNVVNLSGTAMSPVDALSCLEQGLADCKCGGRGMIHATSATVTQWVDAGLLRREGNQLLTFLDTIVVPGEGYPGTGPLGEAPADGSVWAYATELVQVRLGAIDVQGGRNVDGLDRRVNTATLYAQRLAAVDWDGCCHLAVEVDVPLCGVGGS